MLRNDTTSCAGQLVVLLHMAPASFVDYPSHGSLHVSQQVAHRSDQLEFFGCIPCNLLHGSLWKN